MKQSPKRILVLSASVGAGHMRAAEAVEAAVRQFGNQVVVENHDILTLTPTAFKRLYGDAYLEMVGRAPELLGWIYDAMDKPFRHDPLRMAIEQLNARKFINLLKSFQPELLICTHFLPASLAYMRRKKETKNCRVVTVVTDFDIHGMWLATPSDHYFVAVDEGRAHLAALGIPAGQITVTGIPTHPVFAQTKDRAAMRRKHGFHPDLPAILLSAGGFGVGNVAQIVEKLLPLTDRVQLIAACGKSESLKEELTALTSASKNVKVLGFTREMDEFMTAADIMLGKPGGLTTWESFTKGLAWVVVNPIPGQEERNAIHMLEAGAAIWSNNLHTLAYKVEQLLDDPGRLARMREASRKLARPDAAAQIAKEAIAF